MVTRELIDMITTELIEALERNARDALVIVNDSALEALGPGRIAYDHINPDGLTGSNDLNNCAVLCLACHKQKTRDDVGNIAKAKRREAKHIGAHKSRNPLPGGKDSGWKRKMTGEWVKR
jgi:5-methylcytosine-specific restriction protein A